jgi:hypothetical protein
MRRREFITLLGGAAAWPLAARAQPAAPKTPRIGIVDDAPRWNAFRHRLRDVGYLDPVTQIARKSTVKKVNAAHFRAICPHQATTGMAATSRWR